MAVELEKRSLEIDERLARLKAQPLPLLEKTSSKGHNQLNKLHPWVSMAMVLHPTLGDILDDFLYCEMARVVHQAAELEAAMELHQARMKDVCYSIKAHYLWETLEFPFPDFSEVCRYCGETISPEFDLHRHMGLCELKERLNEDSDSPSAHESFYPHLYPLERSWV